MSAPRDLDRQIQSFLVEGPLELPDPSYDQVRERMEKTRQRAAVGPWRAPDVNRYLQIGLAAAAVLVVVVVGFQFLGGPNTGGPGTTETPRPTSTPAVTPVPTNTPAGLLPEGPHILWDRPLGVTIDVTIPAPGWYGEPDGGILVKNDNPDAPDGAGLTVFAAVNDLLVGLGDLYVYGDPCHWASTKPDTPVTTVDEAVAALSSQASRDASTPIDVTLDGYAGKSITLHVPNDVVFSDCDQSEFRTWVEGETSARYHQDPGQFDLVWVLDVNGELVIFDVAYYEGTPPSVLDEMGAIVESATLDYSP